MLGVQVVHLTGGRGTSSAVGGPRRGGEGTIEGSAVMLKVVEGPRGRRSN